jgi:type IV secretion system protein VirB10
MESRLSKIARNLLPTILWAVGLFSALILGQRFLSGETMEHQRQIDKDLKSQQEAAQSAPASPEAIAALLERQAENARRDAGRPASAGVGAPAGSPPASQAPGAGAAVSPQQTQTGRLASSAPRSNDPPLRMPADTPPGARSGDDVDGGDTGTGGGALPPGARIRAQARASDISAYEDTTTDAPIVAPRNPVNDLLDRLKTSPGTPPSPLLDYSKALQAANAPRPAAAGGNAMARNSEDWLSQQNQQGNANDQPLVPKPAPPSSEFMLFEGTSIRVALLSDINSDLPGSFNAMVTRDVYDSINATRCLIPKGQKIRGSYNSEIVPGQNRLLFAFTRMIFPSGASLRMGAMPGSDMGGAAGAQAEVDSHFWSIFGTSLAVGTVAAMASAGGNGSSNVTINVGGAGNTLATQVLSDVVKQMLNRNQNIKSTLSLKKGDELTVIINRDMVLPPSITGVKHCD